MNVCHGVLGGNRKGACVLALLKHRHMGMPSVAWPDGQFHACVLQWGWRGLGCEQNSNLFQEVLLYGTCTPCLLTLSCAGFVPEAAHLSQNLVAFVHFLLSLPHPSWRARCVSCNTPVTPAHPLPFSACSAAAKHAAFHGSSAPF